MKDYQLYEHQKKAVEVARDKNEFALFFDMGTGKTLTMLEILKTKYAENAGYKTLIVCPLAVVYNWKNEIAKFTSFAEDTVVLEGGNMQKSSTLYKTNKNIVIVNIDSFSRGDFWKAAYNWSPDILVIDESHLVKTYNSSRSKNLFFVAKRTKYRYILTGTPILNSPLDVFQQFKILDLGKTFGENFFAFRSQYFYDANSKWSGRSNYFPNWVPIKEKFPELSEKIYQKGMRVLKSQCLDLPEIVYQNLEVQMTKEQLQIYKQMKDNLIAFIDSNDGKTSDVAVAKVALTKILRLQQIVSGHITLDDGTVRRLDCSTRLNALETTLDTVLPNKIIIWAQFKYDYKILEEFLNNKGYKYVKLTGDCSAKDKQDSIDVFNNSSDVNIIIANQASGGTGINLTSASYDITWSRGFNLGNYLQSHDRNYRLGSEIHEKITKISIIAVNSIDELITKKLLLKEATASEIVDAVVKFFKQGERE
ncbi:MAG: DEAD/DEAH box helicase [Patescibacteria group bacterium]|nr:DEAD/DEAH box helicase [Patescibacteria group bacterium]